MSYRVFFLLSFLILSSACSSNGHSNRPVQDMSQLEAAGSLNNR